MPESSPARHDASPTPKPFWAECLRLASSSRRLRMIVEETTLVSLSEGLATIAVSAHLAGLARNSISELAELFSRAAGNPTRLAFQESEQHGPRSSLGSGTETPTRSAEPAASATEDAAYRASATPPAEVRIHPLVKQAEELFGARVVRVDASRPT